MAATNDGISYFVNLILQLKDEEKRLERGPLTLEEIRSAATSLQANQDLLCHLPLDKGVLPYTICQSHATLVPAVINESVL